MLRLLIIANLLLAALILTILFCKDCFPKDHVLRPGQDAEAAGCYCALRMKGHVSIADGKYIKIPSRESVPAEDCDEVSEAGRVAKLPNQIAVCDGLTGWNYTRVHG